MKRRTFSALFAAVAATLALGAAHAADYPSKTITLIVPFAAGGPTDTVARLLGQAMAADLKQCEAAAPMVPQGRTPAGPRTKPGSNTIDFDSASERAFDRMRKDDEHIAGCMRAKGYVR